MEKKQQELDGAETVKLRVRVEYSRYIPGVVARATLNLIQLIKNLIPIKGGDIKCYQNH